MHDKTPDYLKTPILPLQLNSDTNRFANVFRLFRSRTDTYLSSFYPDSVAMWNDMAPDLRGAESLSVFKKKLMEVYRPKKKEIFNIYDSGIKWIFQLRVGLSPLKSHKKST